MGQKLNLRRGVWGSGFRDKYLKEGGLGAGAKTRNLKLTIIYISRPKCVQNDEYGLHNNLSECDNYLYYCWLDVMAGDLNNVVWWLTITVRNPMIIEEIVNMNYSYEICGEFRIIRHQKHGMLMYIFKTIENSTRKNPKKNFKTKKLKRISIAVIT